MARQWTHHEMPRPLWLDAEEFVRRLAMSRVPTEDVQWFQQGRADFRHINRVMIEMHHIRAEDYPVNSEDI